MAKTGKPNILILWGDDIGIWNISHFSRGMMGYRTPNIDRIAEEGVDLHRLLLPAELHGRPRLLHHRPEPDPHRPHQGRHARRHGRPAEGRSDHRRTAQAAGLRHRPVRQEPSGRPRRIPADRARLRRILRQSLSPERRGRAGAARLSQGPGLQEEVRPARRAALQGRRQGRADDHGHRPAHQEAHGNHRRGDHRQALAWMETQAKADKPFFLWYNSTAMHFRTHVAEKNLGKSGQDPYSDRMVVHDEQIGQMLDKLDELGIADNTIVMYSTDNGPENDTWPDGANTPVPRPEGLQLGRRLARALLHALAGQDQARLGLERHRLAHRHVPDAAGRSPATRTSPSNCSTAARSAARNSTSISTATT